MISFSWRATILFNFFLDRPVPCVAIWLRSPSSAAVRCRFLLPTPFFFFLLKLDFESLIFRCVWTRFGAFVALYLSPLQFPLEPRLQRPRVGWPVPRRECT